MLSHTVCTHQDGLHDIALGGFITTYGTENDANAGLTFPAAVAALIFENGSAVVRTLPYSRSALTCGESASVRHGTFVRLCALSISNAASGMFGKMCHCDACGV